MWKIAALLTLVNTMALGQDSLFFDRLTVSEIKTGIASMYSARYDEAQAVFEGLEKRLPGSPAGPLLSAMNIYWKYMPLETEPLQLEKYKNTLIRAAGMAEKILEKKEEDIAGTFFLMTARSLLTRVYADEEDYLKAMSEAGETYQLMKKGFDLQQKYNEFYFSSGLYHYYREQYPESHTVYKLFASFFASGNKQQGLREMETAAREATFSATEAMLYLSNIYLRYERRADKALKHSRQLVENYPGNLYFTVRHAESLLAAKKYEEAAVFAGKLQDSANPFYKLSYQVFSGQLQEHYHKNPAEAAKYYKAAIAGAGPLRSRASDYEAMAHVGLAHIALGRGDRKTAAEHYRKAADLTDYEAIRQEAAAFSE